MAVFRGYQKGVNLGGWLSQCVSYDREHFTGFITEQDIARISGWGMDHVRLPVDVDVIETDRGEIREDGYAYIENCVRWCRKYGLNLVLDLHKAHGFMFDTNVVSDPDRFFTDEHLQEMFIATWEKLILRFGKDKDIVAFELLNEVVNPAYEAKWNGIASRAIRCIRSHESDAVIIVGGVRHNSVVSVPGIAPEQLKDGNLVLNFHCYEPLCFTHQHAYWVENTDYDLPYPAPLGLYEEKSRALNQDQTCLYFSGCKGEIGPDYFETLFRDAVSYADSLGLPLYCGEYGVIDRAALEDSVRWIRDINSVFDRYGIGRALWNYKEKDFGMIGPHYAPGFDELIGILAR